MRIQHSLRFKAVKPETNKLIANISNNVRPRILKHDFSSSDDECQKVSKEEHRSFRDLVWRLIFARDITNELEKARSDRLHMMLSAQYPLRFCLCMTNKYYS